MSDNIYFDGVRYISAGEAAERAGLTRDYVTRLCKEGKILGKRIGKQWYASQASLDAFIIEQDFARAKRRQDLAESRKLEYKIKSEETPHVRAASPAESLGARTPIPSEHRTHASDALRSAVARMPVASAARAARTAASVPLHAISIAKHGSLHAVAPLTDAIHKIIALAAALLFTVGTYAFVDAQYARIAQRSTSLGASLLAGARGELAAVAEDPSAVPEILARLARALNASVDSFVYGVMFPNGAADDSRPGTVFVRVVPAGLPISS